MDTTKRIEQLERQVRALTAVLVVGLACVALVTVRAQSAPEDNLRVRQLTVVDAEGTDRVIIAAPLPDPIIQGTRRTRTGAISGMALLDPNGNERAGFATSDFAQSEVFIGMDSEMGQEVRLLVNAQGGSHLTFFDRDANYARIGIWPGRPALELRNRGEVVFQPVE